MIKLFPEPLFLEKKCGHYIVNEKVYLHLDAEFDKKEFLDFCPVLWNNFTAKKVCSSLYLYPD